MTDPLQDQSRQSAAGSSEHQSAAKAFVESRALVLCKNSMSHKVTPVLLLVVDNIIDFQIIME
jgi:hypothetical protein